METSRGLDAALRSDSLSSSDIMQLTDELAAYNRGLAFLRSKYVVYFAEPKVAEVGEGAVEGDNIPDTDLQTKI